MEQTPLIISIIYWICLAISGFVGFIYFRDLGDATQLFFNVKRKNMLWFIRNEIGAVGVGISAAILAAILHFFAGAGGSVSFWVIMVILITFYGFTYTWLHIGLRNQQNTAKYYSIEEAKKWVAPEDNVIVIENKGHARAHPDYEMWRPHLAGNPEGLGGENVIMTYCSMTHLGLGVKPEIDGENLKLKVLAQHGNNLLVRDQETREPIQQVYCYRERDGKSGPRMQEWPTFRMTFRGFEKAYPNGEVFLNRPSKNPFYWLVDQSVNLAFLIGLTKQYRYETPLMGNVEHIDRRLPLKTFVWGFNINEDYTCYTEDFVKTQKAPVNARVGNRNIVASYDYDYESLNIWYNDSDTPVQRVDFWGDSDQGQLTRVETVKAGSFWHVWANFFPETDINRVTEISSVEEAA